MSWLKYRQNFSSGHGIWEWKYIGSAAVDDEISDLKSQLHQEYDWSEHYRGCDIEVGVPPITVVAEEIAKLERYIRWSTKTLEQLNLELEQMR